MAEANGPGAGVITRTIAALRYAATGHAPADWFGAGEALPDQAPKGVKGRQFDFPFYVNLNYLPRSTERVGFEAMKRLAQHCEPLKMVMRRQRDLVKALEWQVKPRLKGKAGAGEDAGAREIAEFLEMPDREHDWPQWLNGVLDQLFVYDAVSIYARGTRGGELYALEQIDGSTITALVDDSGRRPLPPDAAFKQVLKGLPAVSYTSDELIYYPEHFRPDHIYGCSRVEDVIATVESAIARLRSQLGYFTHGNVGDGYFTAPEGFSAEQIAKVERAWNAQMSPEGGARLADRRQVPFFPAGVAWNPTKVDIFQAEFDEWLVRLICFQFGVPPTPFLKQMGLGQGSAATDKEAAEEGGTAPLMEYVRRLMNRILATRFGRPDLEFAWVEDRELDPKTAAEIDDKRLRNGSKTLDEVRDRNGDAPLPAGLGAKPLFYTAGGAVLLETAVQPPSPPPPPPGLAPPPGEEGATAKESGQQGAEAGASFPREEGK